ncbi:MAG: hypothetical protein A2566_02110 [Candidatus Zambryskibacteria bacterium RIFOXYD1_FULL_40_13]|nr:MAG: hypothetical protein UT25_C0003G0065 [Parcubacteria group bacterium GW2011_GWC1_39_12]KKR18949.1 MAG: hypothetical protein UT49_C0005G0015 [Parcubacteria group bacterium GW2011_GWF1_39_37]KKR51985.1 MAG: hypothetical protein UT89_C0004G0071 [Parcubacteria group bacterium GW2011_GWE1_40_20]KKR68486.1 MAG: hypothetical protein UU11_C0011G0033 [Parcubacteria group bacterium GW2011_GWF2_40_69]KKR80299.1 MAG: hypothetical protein UU27_C0032G0006 [Parcubacteria group bacterium GW2011_GWD1_40_
MAHEDYSFATFSLGMGFLVLGLLLAIGILAKDGRFIVTLLTIVALASLVLYGIKWYRRNHRKPNPSVFVPMKDRDWKGPDGIQRRGL